MWRSTPMAHALCRSSLRRSPPGNRCLIVDHVDCPDDLTELNLLTMRSLYFGLHCTTLVVLPAHGCQEATTLELLPLYCCR